MFLPFIVMPNPDREKQGANQDKSLMGLARGFIQEESERVLDSRVSQMPLAVHGNDEPSALLAGF